MSATCPGCGAELALVPAIQVVAPERREPWYDPLCWLCSGRTFILEDGESLAKPCPKCRPGEA